MEVSQALRTAYFGVLDGNITFNGNVVPVYDYVGIPSEENYPYILLSTQTSVQRGDPKCTMYDCTLLVDIVTGTVDRPKRTDSEQIAEQIDALVTTEMPILEYQIMGRNRESDTDLSNVSGSYKIVRKLMRYNHLINKL